MALRLSSDPVKAREFFRRAGILDADGRITLEYLDETTPETIERLQNENADLREKLEKTEARAIRDTFLDS